MLSFKRETRWLLFLGEYAAVSQFKADLQYLLWHVIF